MTALGFDLATHSAYALVQAREHKRAADPEYAVIEAGTITAPGHYSLIDRLAHLREKVSEIMRRSADIELVTYERVPSTWRGAGVVAVQNMQYGAFLTALVGYDAPVIAVSPEVWQRDMLTYAPRRQGERATARRKLLKQESIRQARWRAGYEIEDDNVADAVNIAIWGLRQMALRGATT